MHKKMISANQLRKIQKKSKFGNVKKDGYASTKEANRAKVLELLEKNGIVTELKKQVRFVLAPKQTGKNWQCKEICLRRELVYIADFTYINSIGEYTVEDVKGFKTKEYIRKRNLMLKVFNIKILET